ncbi:hypothetical protein [Aureivirga sp. CE67]|uniref:hypothetical protein n=1 Tax=Aureivirga sp. CE67 TaxID=1788983 RepID=UPI0018C986FF|nr:hypothetical protein [Aureivirga sp. CE67]
MKTKILLIIILSYFFFLACSNTKDFEGTVKFRFTSTLINKNNEVDLDHQSYIQRQYGKYFEETHKNGNYYRKYFGTDSISLDYQVYIKKNNIKYTKYNYNDTLYWQNCTNLNRANSFEILKKKKNDTIIENEKFDLLITKYKQPFDYGTYEFYEKYYYNNKLKINANDFKKYKQSFLNKTFEETNAIPYMYVKKLSSDNFEGYILDTVQFVEKKNKSINSGFILNKISNRPLKKL